MRARTENTTFDSEALRAQIARMPVQQLIAETRQFEQVVQSRPRDSIARLCLHLLYLQAGSLQQALSQLKKAYQLDKSSPQTLEAMSLFLMHEQHDYKQALQYLRRWQSVEPGRIDPMLLIAECQYWLQKHDSALETLQKAERVAPTAAGIFELRAEVHKMRGDADQARKAFEAYMKVGNNPAVASSILGLPGFEPAPELIEKIESLLQAETNPAAIARACSNLGAYYDRTGQYETAFEYFEKQNELARTGLDRRAVLEAFRNVKSAFTSSFISEESGQGNESPAPVFIVGMPRSGKSLVEELISSHPRVAAKGEVEIFYSHLRNLGLEIPEKKPFRIGDIPVIRSRIRECPANYYKQIANHHLERVGRLKSDQLFQVDTTPLNFFAVGLIHLAFPNSKIIHLNRHPLDTAIECYKKRFRDGHTYASDLEFLGIYYRQYRELMEHWREVLTGRMIEIHFEDLVTNTEQVGQRLMDHLGLRWEDCSFNGAERMRTIGLQSIGTWKHYGKQLQPVVDALGPTVYQYEGELSGLGIEYG